MNKLWTFGDSFTAGHGCTSEFEYYQKYYKEGDKLWPQHLAQELNLELMNLGENGASNEQIIDSIILNYDKILTNDIVIIEKSYPQRLDVPNMKIEERYNWISVFPNFKFDMYLTTLSKEQYETAINFCYYFANDSRYKQRQNLRFDFLVKSLIKDGIKVFVWDLLEIRNKMHPIKYQSIRDATNNEISDGHLSFKGHFEFYKWIYQEIK